MDLVCTGVMAHGTPAYWSSQTKQKGEKRGRERSGGDISRKKGKEREEREISMGGKETRDDCKMTSESSKQKTMILGGGLPPGISSFNH